MIARTCGLAGLGFVSSLETDPRWPSSGGGARPDWPDGLAEEFRAAQGSWRQMWIQDVATCKYPGGILDGCPKKPSHTGMSDWVPCGFYNLLHDKTYGMHDLPSTKPQPEIAGPVQTINGLELGIRYAHFCKAVAGDHSMYQAAFISPYHDISQWDFDGQHYLDWVPLASFLSKAEFDLVGTQAERQALVDGMRQFGLRDDGILGQEVGGSSSTPCQQSGTCSSELPEPYSCSVSEPVYPTETGCGRGGRSPCSGRCLDQELYHQQCDNRECPVISTCCHISEGANETVVRSQVWYGHNTGFLLV